MKVAIIGGGAAGFFSAIKVKENYPSAEVVILEKTTKLLSKVKVSGGGRCNVTNGTESIKTLVDGYPRGAKFLKKLFKEFRTTHIRAWFENEGIALYEQDDHRVFPISDDSQTIIDCFLRLCTKYSIAVKTKVQVNEIIAKDTKIELLSTEGTMVYDKVIVATGGGPKKSSFDWLAKLGHEIMDPVPSLFTFNMPKEPIVSLMGVVAPTAQINIQGSKLKSVGPLLITHWGMSGPGILKLSAFGARELAKQDYHFKAQVNWMNVQNDELVKTELLDIAKEHPQKKMQSVKPFNLPNRLWLHLLDKAEISHDKKWVEFGKKSRNKLIALLTNDTYQVSGKTTFKEEFVTCGGISLEGVHPRTLESKYIPNLYFAGEVLDIDGITGGYNFQAAWTTAYFAAKLESREWN